jgi:hypothetical protein
MNYLPKCRPDKIEALRQAISETTNEHLKDIFFDDDFSLDDKGNLEYTSWIGKWHHTEEFAKFLAPFLVAGRITFQDEDGEYGYELDGEENAYNLIYDIHRGEQL